MNRASRVIVFLVCALVFLGLAYLLSEKMEVDCQRRNGDFRCVLVSQTHGRQTVREFDSRSLLSVSSERRSRWDNELSSFTETYHLVFRTNTGIVRSGRGSFKSVQNGIQRMNAFLTDRRQDVAHVELDNRREYYAIAGLMLLVVAYGLIRI